MAKEELNPYSDSYGIAYSEGDTSLERIPYSHSPSSNDVSHTVLDGENIFAISNKYYGEPGMWSIIADVNKLDDVTEEVVPGLKLLIPNGRQ